MLRRLICKNDNKPFKKVSKPKLKMTKQQPKRMSERKEAWFRIIVLIVSGIILSIWKILIQILAIINWIITVCSGKRNKAMAELSEYWNTEMYKFVRYMTFVSNVRPFPFSDVEAMTKFEKNH